MDKNIGIKIDKVKLTAKQKLTKAGHWAKDHWVQLVLGGLAIGGGAYAYTRLRGNGSEEQQEYNDCGYNPTSEEIREAVQEAWDACDHDDQPYEGPTED